MQPYQRISTFQFSNVPIPASILRALASGDAKKKKKHILHLQTLLYLFCQPILQLTLHLNFYFYIQPNKII